jgi:Protein of unknown function (DUF1573)/HEAT repeats
MGTRITGYVIAAAVTCGALGANSAFGQTIEPPLFGPEDILPAPPKVPDKKPKLDLADVPEIHFQQPLTKAMATADAVLHVKRTIDDAHRLNQKKTDAFIETLRSSRPNLAGLSFAMGDDCRMKQEASRQFVTALADLGRAKDMNDFYKNHGIERDMMHTYAAIASPSAEWPAGWAEGLFEELTFDFGAVPRGQQLTHSFRVVNNTKNSVLIRSVRPSGCSSVSARALKYTLAPAEETAIIAHMDSRRFIGVKPVAIYVTLDSPVLDRLEYVRLTVQANSKNELAFIPESLDFKKIKHGSTPTSQMTVTFMGSPKIALTDVKSDSNFIQPKVQELRREGGEVIYQVSATARADMPEGKWHTDVWLTTNDASMPKVRVPVTVEVEPGAKTPRTVEPVPEVMASAPKAAQRRVRVEIDPAARVTSLMQVLAPESAETRLGLVEYLDSLAHPDATRALAKLAIFSEEPEIRSAAVRSLKMRRDRDYTDILLAGLKYPWPAVAERSSEAIVKLGRGDLVPHLIEVLESPDPRAPQTREINGKKVSVVRELVRINHHHNCLLCHAPATSSRDGASKEEAEKLAPLTAQIPVPSESMTAYYRPSNPDILVRFDVTYLRQDFSVKLPVKDADPWPEMQRYDFLVRTREVTEEEAGAYREFLQPSGAENMSPYQRAALSALRELTGHDMEARAAARRKKGL